MRSISLHPPRSRRALGALVAAAFATLVALGPAHATAHGGAAAHCATCHVVRHAPATLAVAPTLDVAVETTPLHAPTAPRPVPGRALRPQSRGPPR